MKRPATTPGNERKGAPITFEGQVAVVTGAGGGLGADYARELARRGASVVVNDLAAGHGAHATSAPKRIVDEIRKAGGVAVPSEASVSDPEDANSIVETALDAFGRVDILVNNAGVLRDRSFAKLESEGLQETLAVHLLGAFYVSQPAFRIMREQRYGRIIFTSSAAGLWGNFGQASYAAAKMGLVGLASVLAIEGKPYGIGVNTIAPVARTTRALDIPLFKSLPDSIAPDRVTPLTCFLASQACDLTGQVFSVGGGRFARVIVGVNQGWYAGPDTVTVEDVADHTDEISSARQSLHMPQDALEELDILAQRITSFASE